MKRDGDADWCQHGSTRWPEMRTDRYGGGQKRGMEAEGGDDGGGGAGGFDHLQRFGGFPLRR